MFFIHTKIPNHTQTCRGKSIVELGYIVVMLYHRLRAFLGYKCYNKLRNTTAAIIILVIILERGRTRYDLLKTHGGPLFVPTLNCAEHLFHPTAFPLRQ